MSDGDFGADEATPDAASGPSRASGLDRDDVGPTGTRGAAPWERFGAPTQAVAVAHRRPAPPVSARPAVETDHDHDHDHDTGGCHTNGGLTVADLIAKVGGPATNRPTHHHAAADFERPDDGYDAYAASTSTAYPFDLPELELSEP